MRTIQPRRVGVEEGLKTGLRNVWNPILQSAQLTDKPVGIKRLGEDLVLWRAGDGKPRLFTDLCPHRGVKLSLGHVIDGTLNCWYHGFQFSETGQCIGVPIEGGECKLSKRVRVKTYPVEERAGLIWAYIGETDLFVPPPLVLPSEMEDPKWTSFVFEASWDTNWLLLLDNLADVMHAPYLHARSYTLGKGIKHDHLKVIDLPDGFRVEREKQQGVNFDWAEFHNTGAIWFKLDIPYPWSAGPGGPMRIVGFSIAIDDEHALVYFVRMRHVQGWQRTLWRNLYKARLEGKSFQVVEQDRVILESQRGLQSRLAEHLSQSDVGVIRLRKLLNMEYARQQEIYNRAIEFSIGNSKAAELETEQEDFAPIQVEDGTNEAVVFS